MPQLLKSLAAELKHSPVSVHLASPGMVATDLLLKGHLLLPFPPHPPLPPHSPLFLQFVASKRAAA